MNSFFHYNSKVEKKWYLAKCLSLCASFINGGGHKQTIFVFLVSSQRLVFDQPRVLIMSGWKAVQPRCISRTSYCRITDASKTRLEKCAQIPRHDSHTHVSTCTTTYSAHSYLITCNCVEDSNVMAAQPNSAWWWRGLVTIASSIGDNAIGISSMVVIPTSACWLAVARSIIVNKRDTEYWYPNASSMSLSHGSTSY